MLTTLARNAHATLGAILIVFGVWTFSDPAILHRYGIDTSEPNARIALRAIIGGGELGLGVTLLAGEFLKLDQRTLNFMAATVFLSVGVSRLLAASLERSAAIGSQSWREGAIEMVLGAMAVLGFLAPDRQP